MDDEKEELQRQVDELKEKLEDLERILNNHITDCNCEGSSWE